MLKCSSYAMHQYMINSLAHIIYDKSSNFTFFTNYLYKKDSAILDNHLNKKLTLINKWMCHAVIFIFSSNSPTRYLITLLIIYLTIVSIDITLRTIFFLHNKLIFLDINVGIKTFRHCCSLSFIKRATLLC